jgi:plasmid stabilization system protein ParE
MTQTDLLYELSVEADKDIEDIFDYTTGVFGP